jgi:hypothetical protein
MKSFVSLRLRLGAGVCLLTALLGAPAIGATVVRTMVYHQLSTFTNNGVVGTARPLMVSANGQKMVFSRPWYGTPRSNLVYTVNFDGSALTLADSWAIDPGAEVDISADGSKIISYQSGLCRVAAADGSSANTIVQLEGGYSTFRLSSDGAFVYFLVDRDTALWPSHQGIEAGVYRIGANGSNLQMLANRTNVAQFFGTTPDQISPFFGGYGLGPIALSGNGARLLFQCYKGGYRLIGMNSDGSGMREYPLGTVPDIYAFDIWNFGLSGDGNKLFYHVGRNTGPQEVGVFNFDGTGQRGLLTNNIGLFGEVMQLNPDGSKLLLGGTGWLLNTDGSGRLELGWSARFAVNNVLQWGFSHGVMDTNATHFAYLTPAGANDGGRLQLGSAELNPASLGLSPTITSPSANPAYITTNGPSPVFAFHPAPTNGLLSGGGAQAGILLNGIADPATWQGSSLHDDGLSGDAVNGDGIYSDNTGYYANWPTIGPRMLRYKAELLAGDGKYHATAIDVAPFFVLAQAPTNPPPAIISITPSNAPPGSSVTITGTGFDPIANNNVILFGNVPAQIISVNPAGTQLVVVVPSGLPAGPVAVTVSSTGQTSGTLSFGGADPYASSLVLKMLAGLDIYGTVGMTYRIDYLSDVTNTNNWTALTNLTLPSSPYFWVDVSSTNQPRRFYRSVRVP